MIKHIVMFRLKDYALGAGKAENIQKIESLLKALPSKIPQIKGYEIGINITESDRASDLVLISSFDNLDDLKIYIDHPEHQKVAEFIMQVREDSRVVDYVV